MIEIFPRILAQPHEVSTIVSHSHLPVRIRPALITCNFDDLEIGIPRLLWAVLLCWETMNLIGRHMRLDCTGIVIRSADNTSPVNLA